jgi:serine/threonine protein kinase
VKELDQTVSMRLPGGIDPIASRLSDRYRVGALLGAGGMADVYAGEDTLLRRAVAIKVFRPSSVIGDEEIRHQGEIRLLAGLNHPGLVTLFDAGTDQASMTPRSYLVMELISGRAMSELLRSGPLPPSDVADLGAQLAEALAYVHAHGIVHRDVKPANILVDTPDRARPREIRAKLTDFGVARLLDDTRITELGLTVGTANYLSPEQAMAHEVGRPSDIYSLGLVLLECLTGQVAFPGRGVEAAGARLHRGPVIPVSLGPTWTRLLTEMTAASPDARPTAIEVARTLGQIVPPTNDDSRLTELLAAATTDALGPLAGIAWDRHPSLSGPWLHHHRRAPRVGRRTIVLATSAAVFLAAVLSTILLYTHGSSSATVTPANEPPPGQSGSDLHQLQPSGPAQLTPSTRAHPTLPAAANPTQSATSATTASPLKAATSITVAPTSTPVTPPTAAITVAPTATKPTKTKGKGRGKGNGNGNG